MSAPRPCRRALVVDDDETTREFVTMALGFDDVEVDGADSPETAAELLAQHDYDCVILDVDMPTGSGVTFIHQIRAAHDVAIIMFTGCDDSPFVVVALEAGADDYIVKPVTERELTLRVRKAIAVRAVTRTEVRRVEDGPVVISAGALTIDPFCRLAVLGGTELDLTAKEFDLLVALATEPGRVFSREDLLAAVWDAKPDWQSLDTVTEHIYRLRQKLDAPGAARSWIQTLRGAGYRLDRRRAEDPEFETNGSPVASAAGGRGRS